MVVLPSVMLHSGGLCPIKLCSLWGPRPRHHWCWGEDAPGKRKSKWWNVFLLISSVSLGSISCRSLGSKFLVKVLYHDSYKSNIDNTNTLPLGTHDADVPELVSGGHGVVVQQTGCCHPARTRVVSEDDELVLITSVTDPEQALLNVRHDHTLADCMDASHQVGNVLKRRKERDKVSSEDMIHVCCSGKSP